MKIKNLKYSVGLLGLYTTLTLTGCGLADHPTEPTTSVEFLEESEVLEAELDYLLEDNYLYKEDKQVEVELPKEVLEEAVVQTKEEKVVLDSQEITQLVNELNRELEPSVTLSTYCNLDNISIFMYYNSKTRESLNLSDDFYSNFNLLLSQGYSYSLSLCEIGCEIDFSKLDLSNIGELYLEHCKENFNYGVFAFGEYDKLVLVDIPFECGTELVKECTNSEIELQYFNYQDENNDNLEFLRFLVDNNIYLGLYSGIDMNYQEDEVYNLLSSLNAREVKISEVNKGSILNLSLNLNDRIERFSISDSYYRELGNIEILSNNPDFCLGLKYVKVIGDTKFSLPDNSSLEMSGIYKDIAPFYGLSNISDFLYFDCDKEVSIYGYKQVFEETIDEIQELHGKRLAK